MTLKIGDVVYLKSDGLAMTVQSVDGEFVKVAWFPVDKGVFGTPVFATFHANTLRQAA